MDTAVSRVIPLWGATKNEKFAKLFQIIKWQNNNIQGWGASPIFGAVP